MAAIIGMLSDIQCQPGNPGSLPIPCPGTGRGRFVCLGILRATEPIGSAWCDDQSIEGLLALEMELMILPVIAGFHFPRFVAAGSW